MTGRRPGILRQEKNKPTCFRKNKSDFSSGMSEEKTSPFPQDPGPQGPEIKEPHALELKVPPVVVFGFFAAAMWSVAVYFPVFDVDIPFRIPITIS